MEGCLFWSAGLYALGIIGIYGTPHINMDSSWVIAISTNVLLLGSSMCSIHGFAALADLMSSYRMSNKIEVDTARCVCLFLWSSTSHIWCHRYVF